MHFCNKHAESKNSSLGTKQTQKSFLLLIMEYLQCLRFWINQHNPTPKMSQTLFL